MRLRSAVCAAVLLLLVRNAAGEPDRADTLVVCDDVADPATLDPQKEFVEKNHTILQQIFDGLVRIDSEGRIVPALATQWRWIDERTLELALRHGVVFHDGEPFTADAVKFTLDRYLDAKTGFPARGYLDSIQAVRIVDPFTVRIETRFPDGILLNKLAGFVLVSPPAYIKKNGDALFARHPVGTGAFRFDHWIPGKEIVLARNPGYFNGKAGYERLVFKFSPPREQVKQLLRGDVDIVTELPGTDTLRVVRSGVATVVKKESFYSVAGSINISSSPLADIRIRKALNYAINRDELIRYDLLGNGRPIAALSMAGEVGHAPGLAPYPYDIRKARRLLREAGYPHGIDLNVIIKYQTERSAQILANQLSRAGFRLKVHKSADATLSDDIRNGRWDFTFGGCPDPLAHSFFIQSIFLSSQSPFSIMRNPEYDRRLSRMVSTIDPLEQQKIGMEIDRYIYDQALSIFTYQKIRTYGVKRGVRFIPWVTGMPYFDKTEPEGANAKRTTGHTE